VTLKAGEVFEIAMLAHDQCRTQPFAAPRSYHISRTLQPCELRERGFIDFISRGNYLWRA
jgi:hypothetical protein